MKTFTANFLVAADSAAGVRYQARLRFYPSKFFAELADLDLTHVHPAAEAAGVRYDQQVLPQAAGYDTILERPIGVVLDGADLDLIVPGAAPVQLLTGLAYHSPGIYARTLGYISGTTLRYGEISGSTLQTVQDVDAAISIAGAVRPFDSGLAHLRYDEGGISVDVYTAETGSWVKVTSPHRFMIPGQLWDSTILGTSRLNFSAVTRKGQRLFIYLTLPTGEVAGLTYDLNTKLWGDYFIAVPADLTAFYLSGTYTDTLGNIHLVGQFQRTEEYNAGVTYNLDLWSADGRTFSMDRFTLFSTLGYRFVPCFPRFSPSAVTYSDAGRVVEGEHVYSAYGGTTQENPYLFEIGPQYIESISGVPGDTYTVSLPDGMGAWWRNELLDVGLTVELDLSLNNGLTWERYDTCVLLEKDVDHVSQYIRLQIQNEAVWRVSDLSYPMYIEIQGKQAELDKTNELENLFEAPLAAGVPEIFCARFPTTSGLMGGADSPIEHLSNAPLTILTEDLVGQNSLSEYPLVPAFPFTVNIFGWSRTGPNDTNPNTPDTTPTTAPNDDFQPVFVIKRDGTEQTVTIPKASAVGGICYPPETWDPTGARTPAGAQPVAYSVASTDGLQENDEIIKVGVLVSAPNPAVVYSTVFWLERIEIPAIMQYVSEYSEETWVQVAAETPAATPLTVIGYYEGATTYTGEVDPANPWKWTVDVSQMDPVGGDYFGIRIEVPMTGNWSPEVQAILATEPNFYALATWRVTRVQPNTLGGSYSMSLQLVGDGNYSTSWSWPGSEQSTTDLSTSPATFDVTIGGVGYLLTLDENKATAGGFYVEVGVNSGADQIFTIELIEYSLMIDNGPGYIEEILFDGAVPAGETADSHDYSFSAKGKPSVLFSERPNFTFDFVTRSRLVVTGEDSWGGVIGLASDAKNLVGARIDPGRLQLFKLRGGKITVLASATLADPAPTEREAVVEMHHRHGDFYVYVYAPDAIRPVTPTLSYRWVAAQGALVTDPDIMHVGVYSFLDVPGFRICGFNISEGAEGIGVWPGSYLPDGSNPLSRFPASGTVDIGGVKYTYGDKTPVVKTPRGPFFLRNSGEWQSHTNTLDGLTYAGRMCEFTYFDWTEGKDVWDDYLMASSNGGNWKITDLEHRVYITTGGAVVRLRNRCRGYGLFVNNDDSVSVSDRISLTYGLKDIMLSSGDATWHSEGSLCFLDQDNSMRLVNFFAASDHLDTTIQDMLSRICAMAGARSIFPGDHYYNTNLGVGEERSL